MKITILFFYLLTFIFAFFGCSAPHQYSEKNYLENELHYKVNRTYIDKIENPIVVYEVVFWRDILFLARVQKYITQTSESYGIEIIYNGSSWLFLDGRITIQADKNILKFKDNNPSRMVISHDKVCESIGVTIDKDDLKIIADSEKLRIEFFGAPETIDKKGISFIKRFYKEFAEQ